MTQIYILAVQKSVKIILYFLYYKQKPPSEPYNDDKEEDDDDDEEGDLSKYNLDDEVLPSKKTSFKIL